MALLTFVGVLFYFSLAALHLARGLFTFALLALHLVWVFVNFGQGIVFVLAWLVYIWLGDLFDVGLVALHLAVFSFGYGIVYVWFRPITSG